MNQNACDVNLLGHDAISFLWSANAGFPNGHCICRAHFDARIAGGSTGCIDDRPADGSRAHELNGATVAGIGAALAGDLSIGEALLGDRNRRLRGFNTQPEKSAA